MLIDKRGVGNFVAPWRFLVFAFVSLVAAAILCPWLGFTRGIMGAFDIGAATFLIACVSLFDDATAQMREAATRNDANRGGLLLISTAVTGVILITVASELSQKGKLHLFDLIFLVATLCLCWTFTNLVYALHYAHLFYTRDRAGHDSGGLKFPDTEEPDYWDFAYFSSCLGMTFQTSDVEVTSTIFRRTSMFHCMGAFVFNLGVIAFTINILGSS
jgi:uncharacterized membrane protein